MRKTTAGKSIATDLKGAAQSYFSEAGACRKRRILVAGATGVIGRLLMPELRKLGHEVAGLARHPDNRHAAMPTYAVDAFDARAVTRAVEAFAPDIIIHQLTSLPSAGSMWYFDREFEVTNRLRTEGTRNLIRAARSAGVKRFVAQSFCGWPYERCGSSVKSEMDALDRDPPVQLKSTLDAIKELEALVLGSPNIEGTVLRYGSFYGPHTHLAPNSPMANAIAKRRFPLLGSSGGVWSFIHIEDAATATANAAISSASGVFNVVDDAPAPVAEWLPYLAEVLKVPPPLRMPQWLARIALPAHLYIFMNEVRGGSNALFKQTFDWKLRFPSWREGFDTLFNAEVCG